MARGSMREDRCGSRGRPRSVLRYIDRVEAEEGLRQRPTRTLTLPLTPDHWAYLKAQFPMTAAEKDRLVELLELMVKPHGPAPFSSVEGEG